MQKNRHKVPRHVFKSWTYINFTWLCKHGALVSCARRECNGDRCPYRKCHNMCSVWTAWVQFWGKQYLLHIDGLFFCNILNEQRRIQWVQLDRLKKAFKCNNTYIVIASCVPHIRLPDAHLKFECSVFAFEWIFYFKFDEYSKFIFFFFWQP